MLYVKVPQKDQTDRSGAIDTKEFWLLGLDSN